MKVILLQDVARIGQRFEVKDVPDGHARNFLLPRGMAEAATPENLKRIESRKASLTAKQAASGKAFSDTCAKLGGTTLVMQVKANEEGHLFKGIKASDVAAHVSREVGPIEAEHLELPSPIKETGEHAIRVSVDGSACEFTLNVIAEQG